MADRPQHWRLQLHGAPRLLRPAADGAPATSLALTPKDAALLARVVLDGPMPSARIAHGLWPSAARGGALNNVRQRLHRLRRATGARLLEMGEQLRLADDLAADFGELPEALARDPRAWDDELLAGVELDDLEDFAAWLAQARRQRRERRVQALAQLASAAESAGELARALPFAQRLLADEPLSEHAHRRVMRLHYLRGDPAAAVAAFEACEALLKDQLGLRPGDETLALLRTVEQAQRPLGSALSTLPVPASLLRPPRAIGREAARAQLAQAHADGDVVVLVGEAGIGKSRLLQDFAAAHHDALVVQARPGDATVPYALLGRLLRALEGRLPGTAAPLSALVMPATPAAPIGDRPRPAPPGAPEALAEAFDRVLAAAAAQGCGSLVLDDLHFADAASLELLETLLQRDAPPRQRWLLAHRPPDSALGAAPRLRAIEELERVRWIELGPLDADQLHELLTDLALPGAAAPSPQLAQALARHAGGNPLFVLETLRAMLGTRAGGVTSLPRPQAIERLIDRRLRRLSPPALELMRVAAIAAPDFSPELAEFVLGRPALTLADAWRELEEADVMRGSAFAHDLVHDAALRATPQAIAGHEHGRVARFLQDRGAEPARVATHWQAAQQWGPAAAAWEQAAARAAAASRLREQATLLQHAVRCHLAAGNTQCVGRPAAQAVEALLASAGPDAALARADEGLATPLPGPCAARLLVARASVLLVAGQPQAAADSARRAQALAGEDDPALRLGAERRLAMALVAAGDLPSALALAQPWLGQAEALPAGDRMHLHGDLTHLLLHAGLFAQALPAAERHLALAREVGAEDERMTGLMNLSSLKVLQGDTAAAIALASEADGLLPEALAQLRLRRIHNRLQLGGMHLLHGDYGAALALLEEAAEATREQPAARRLHLTAQHFLARLLVTLGQPARAQVLLAGDAASLPAPVQVPRLLAQALLAQALGQDGAALLRQARALCGQGAAAHERLLLDLELLHHQVDNEARLAAATALQHEAEERGLLGVAAAAGIERIDALRGLQRLDELARLLPAAEQAAWRWRRAYLPALLVACVDAHAALGREAEARRCLSAALDWVHRVALPTVPLAWRDGFLQRNPHNLALAARAARWGDAAAPRIRRV